MTTQRRRITARDVKPLGTCQHAYANSWCYATVAPARGDAFFLVLPKLTTAHMQVFVDAFAATYSYTFNAILLENSVVHTTQRLRHPANVARVFLPPYSPEMPARRAASQRRVA